MLSLGHELCICCHRCPSDPVLGVSLFNIIYPFKMGNSSPGALGYYCCHKLKRTAWRLWSSLLGQDLVTSKYSTFVIMTKTHCSSHCAKINQPSWHSWVSDSRGQWVSLGRNCFLFHRLRDTDSVSWRHTDSVLFSWCLQAGLQTLLPSQASHSRAFGRCIFLHLIKHQSPRLATVIWGNFSCSVWIKRICEKPRNTWMSYEQLTPSDWWRVKEERYLQCRVIRRGITG